FLSNGPYRVAECPHEAALNGLQASTRRTTQEKERFLNALNRKLEESKTSHGGCLMYVNIEINGKTSQAMVDTGETQNFVDVKETKTGMCLTKETERLKAVNSKPLAMEGLAKDVLLKLGSGGRVNFTVVPMDHFEMVLGLLFLTQAKAIPIP
ncbi:LOW QUALITY PROTEIN: Asp_protease domain-containing protein, partial [Cephalotus follicularis]